jgi:hypothetical protein
MTRRFATCVAAATLAIGLACAGPDATSPRTSTSVSSASSASAYKSGKPPGAVGAPHIIAGGNGLSGCAPRNPQYGSATIGSNGGEIDVGGNRLIIPAGALSRTVRVTATVPQATTPTIVFEPQGLRFKKPAGLILDASDCTDVPAVVYINELGVASAPMPAIYSNWWKTIAVPIDHFSGYAVAF